MREDAVAVAFPLACDGRTIAPADIHLAAGGVRPGPIRETGSVLGTDELRERLPGVRFPDGAIGKPFASAPFSQGLEVRVTYADAPCGASSKDLTLPIQWMRGTSIRRSTVARLPTDTTLPSPMAVQLRGVVDLDGAYRFPTVADGPAELAVTATALAAGWRFQQYRANGVPIPQSVITSLMFTTTGAFEPPVPQGRAPVERAAEPPPALVASSTGGRNGEFTTPDVAGLSARTSQCAIATTSTYGFSPAAPIKTGGGPMAGPARERRYLALLRGPAGEGLRMIRRGSTMAPDGDTLLDVYEIAHAALASPVRLYLDEYHDGTLQAPQGFVCAAPIAIR